MRKVSLSLVLMALPMMAQANVPDCEALAAAAGAQSAMPDGLLPAIARMESGYSPDGGPRRAWPWTLNQGGNSMYFDTRADALAYLRRAIEDGVTNIDIGCMQINYYWHSEAFPSLEAMIDPVTNTRYSAAFMAELYSRVGTWEQATAYYHSTDTERGPSYQARVEGIRADIGPIEPAAQTGPIMTSGGALFGAANAPLVALAVSERAMPAARVASPDGLDVVVARQTQMANRDQVPTRLQRDWDKVEFFRDVLSLQP